MPFGQLSRAAVFGMVCVGLSTGCGRGNAPPLPLEIGAIRSRQNPCNSMQQRIELLVLIC